MVAYMEHKDLANTTISDERKQEITDNVHRVLDRLAEATQRAGREPDSVQLLAATKTRDVAEVVAALNAGIRVIGENRPQEITAKIEGVRALCAAQGLTVGVQENAVEPDVYLHLIGQLQSNKINKVLPYANVIESVDSEDLATKIARRATMHDMTARVLLEVNVSGEASKSGCDPAQAKDIAAAIAAMPGIELEGLMTVGAHVEDKAKIRQGFIQLRTMRDELLASGEENLHHCTQLSMGMSGDAEIAIEEGSTQVRLGRAIFGERLFV
ncbi:YggS family pyridoxal phosphate enzyme [Bifidobacterium dolichotidis]|uniref:Pyridoxal phosphate homeostasis protein n=1 Tax=Bifidobacterium dolichotidis TaxID=2306976 RepID=A0A430FRG2_9BIFI|nr:YggS family pyridoxal phosphate-dependent enzyme [Bifidobacterium dolichotidis]RSX55450.1 YggS family pyridoxal phosphate enzyme [Bifidobacterium dolichotidis]